MMIDIPFAQWEGWNDRRFAPNHFFQTYKWFTVLASTWPELEISIRLIDGHTALPVFSRRMGALRLEGSPLRGYSTPYGGFLGEGKRAYAKEFLIGDFNEIALPPGGEGVDGEWKGMRTITVDLRKGCDPVWKGMKSETRTKIRKAQRANVEVRVQSGREWVERAFEILTRTYGRQHVPPTITKRFFLQIADRLVPDPVRVYTAEYEGKMAAYAIIGVDARAAYCIDGGIDRNYRHVAPTHIIQWEVMQWAAGERLESYDMNGANMGSIANFKAGFGGELVHFMTRHYTPTVLGTVAWAGYKLLRPAIKRVKAIAQTTDEETT